MATDPGSPNPPTANQVAATARQSAADPGESSARFLDSLVEAPKEAKTPTGARLAKFLAAQTIGESLATWFGKRMPRDKERIARRLNQDIAQIDDWLSDQINQILHAKPFQKLEASWRGIHYLTEQVDEAGDAGIKVRMLQTTWKELERDFDRALEFDQSELFRKVYEQEFGMPGGEPYGVLLADFEVQPGPVAGHPHDDMGILSKIAEVAAAAFCPVFINAHPAMFGMDNFTSMQHELDHSKTFAQANYLAWRRFRESPHARFVGLTLPRVLMRLPYSDDGTRVDRFAFQEDVTGPDFENYLWGGANFAMGEVLIRAFAQAGWLADIRGVKRDEDRGGLVVGLPTHNFGTDKPGVCTKISTDVVISEELERQLSELGFIPLCSAKHTDYAVFYSNHSAQKPKVFDRPEATTNARISAMLQYMLCVARFAHYIKCLGREKTGSFVEATEFEKFLQDWIVKYVTADTEASQEVKSRHPLRDARVQVFPVPGKPGSFGCTMYLSPHYELDDVHATIKLQAELTTSRMR